MFSTFATIQFATAFGGAVAARDERDEDTRGADEQRPGSWITKTGG